MRTCHCPLPCADWHPQVPQGVCCHHDQRVSGWATCTACVQAAGSCAAAVFWNACSHSSFSPSHQSLPGPWPPVCLRLMCYCRVHVQLEQRKRDRLLCYVLAAVMGPSFVPLSHPDDQKPSVLMNWPVGTDHSWRCFVDVLHERAWCRYGSCLCCTSAVPTYHHYPFFSLAPPDHLHPVCGGSSSMRSAQVCHPGRPQQVAP